MFLGHKRSLFELKLSLLNYIFKFVFQKGLDLVNSKKKQKKKGYVNSGVLYVSQCNVCSLRILPSHL